MTPGHCAVCASVQVPPWFCTFVLNDFRLQGEGDTCLAHMDTGVCLAADNSQLLTPLQ